MMKVVKYFSILIFFCVTIIISASNAKAGDIFDLSLKDEVRMGAEMNKEAEKKWGFIGGDEFEHINTIGQAVIKANGLKMFDKYTLVLLNDKSINAFATPGGYVYLHKGLYDLLKHDDNLIAAVLAHELGHSLHRHMRSQYHRAMNTQALVLLGAILSRNTEIQNYAPVLGDVYLLTYSRDNEYEADREGAWYPAKAGYSSRGMIKVLQILQREPGAKNIEILASHPDISNRITKVENLIKDKIEPDRLKNPNQYRAIPPSTKHLKIDRTGAKDASLKYPSSNEPTPTNPKSSNPSNK